MKQTTFVGSVKSFSTNLILGKGRNSVRTRVSRILSYKGGIDIWTRTARRRRGLPPVNLITSEILEQRTLEDLNKVFFRLTIYRNFYLPGCLQFDVKCFMDVEGSLEFEPFFSLCLFLVEAGGGLVPMLGTVQKSSSADIMVSFKLRVLPAPNSICAIRLGPVMV